MANPPHFKRKITEIIIHCSATPNGRWHNTLDIDLWHEQAGLKRPTNRPKYHEPRLQHIGYHLVIYTTGAIALGRHFNEVGAHAFGHNANSIGICMIGMDRFTAAQWLSLADKIKQLRSQFPAARVIGHRDVTRLKTCPGFDVAAWLADDMKIPSQHLLEPTT